ncbi:unnamed protein product [Cyprideis torosa]|uniref:ceramide glucosyltransferase n=1 Tax=Cyprideis torosa TaxID=163714 RepID=A0A7R8W7Z0_9CRUS|nr:unnamed protein product [Cyprideis torosa]CAG0883730.1 unnamed protein product [Cyprideis torosa]
MDASTACILLKLLCGFIFIWWAGYWIVMHIVALIIANYKLNRKRGGSPPSTLVSDCPPFPPVSIIKPLVGVDSNLASNLETFFTLDYPSYELLFCVQDEEDPAAMVVNSLIKKYPNVPSSLYCGGEKIGVNPKVNNMQPAYQSAKHDLILISDSGIRMKPDTLRDMVEHMTDRVYFGTYFARIYLTADFYRINCCTGMSVLVRKSILDATGGLEPLGKYLGEDYILARTVENQGYRFTIASQPAWQNAGEADVNAFHARLTRWTRLRTAMVPTTLFLEPMSECFPLGILGAISVVILFRWDPIIFLLLHCLAWFFLDYLLITSIIVSSTSLGLLTRQLAVVRPVKEKWNFFQVLCTILSVPGGHLSFTKLEFLIAWVFREATSPLLFAKALRDPAVIRWRKGFYRLHWGGTIEEVTAPPKVTKT